MFDAPHHLPNARFRLVSGDPTFFAEWCGGSRFRLSGEVSSRPEASLDVSTPEGPVEVTLPTGALPEHAIKRLKRALPRSVSLRQIEDDGHAVRVQLLETTPSAAKLPRLRIISSDLRQRVIQLAENQVEFVGSSAHPCLITVLCDGRRVTLRLPAVCSARATAATVGANAPAGYRALVDGATVSVWKDADFFAELVA